MHLILPIIALILNVQDLRNAVFSNHCNGEPFDVRAKIDANDGGFNIIISDGLSFAYVQSTNGIPPKAGTLVRIRGFVDLERNGHSRAYAHTIDTIGTSAPCSPVSLSSDEFTNPDMRLRPIRTSGEVMDIVQDDIDPRWMFLVVRDDKGTFYAGTSKANIDAATVKDIVGCTVELVGYLSGGEPGKRRYLDPFQTIWENAGLKILSSPSSDRFNAPQLGSLNSLSRMEIARMGRRRAEGTVVAVWSGNNILLKTSDGNVLRAELPEPSQMPICGESIAIVGTPETDLFHVNLSHAIFQNVTNSPFVWPKVQTVSASDMLSGRYGHNQVQPHYHGRLIRIRGEVFVEQNGVYSLICDGYGLTMDASACIEKLPDLPRGSIIEVTGTCIIDTENCHPTRSFPRVRGAIVVPRAASDVVIVAQPPWWTSERLLIVIGALLAALVGIVAWNRVLRRMIERKGRELFRTEIDKAESDLRIDERTRLAVELHDNIAQTLTGVSFQIDAAEKTLREDTDATAGYLGVARRTLLSCREELRRCLWDLRSHTIEDANLTDAICKTVRPHAGTAEISVRFNVPRDQLSDSTTHAILCIVRELTVNAVRHGQAAHVRIAGERRDGRIRFSVTDDGRGFDPSNRLGPSHGHFGLQGIRERVNRLNGTLAMTSAPGKGCKTVVELN